MLIVNEAPHAQVQRAKLVVVDGNNEKVVEELNKLSSFTTSMRAILQLAKSRKPSMKVMTPNHNSPFLLRY